MAARRKRTPSTAAERAAPLPPQRSCGTMANHMRLLELNPGYHARLFALEQQTQKFRSAALKTSDLKLATI